MNCDGVWKVEMLGPYGWERIATAFMRKGRYLAASANHYSTGTYQTDGDTYRSSTQLVQHGDLRSLFGRKGLKNLTLKSKGKIKKDKITGSTTSKEGKNFQINFRLTRLGDID